MMTIVRSQFGSSYDMAGAMPGEALYLSPLGFVTTTPLPGRHCGTYVSNDQHFVSYWARLVLNHPCLLFRCEV